ncbi:RtcB family protein [Aromatoleum anaerobium]|uniref:RtcB family protein n=1 Tax=Aromatoleum anaerobium TaxID=182180 RepID=UPI003CCFE322
MPIKQVLTGQRVPVKIWTDDVDEKSKAQLANLAQMPFIHHHVAAMPDAHVGIGATIGSVIATHKAIIPAAVGVDIGCGMVAARLSLTANDIDDRSLRAVFEQISHDVPVGRAQHCDDTVRAEAVRPFEARLKALTERHPQLLKAFGKVSKWTHQMGTLGGGNHFIEICLDEADRVWVMLHSGSRGIGNAMADYFIQLARKDMERWMIQLPDRDLAYFPEGSEHFDDYVEAVQWAQDYARQNRQCMLDLVLSALARHWPPFVVTSEVVNCHHNYVAQEHHFGANVWVTRKGAIRAREGDLGIVPGSMGARSYIVRGKGNAESFCSSARRRAPDEPHRGREAIHRGGSRAADGRRGLPQGQGRHRRNSRRLQGHRRGNGQPERPHGCAAYAEAGGVRQRLDRLAG